MIDNQQASALLRTRWKDVTSFAQEFVSLVKSNATKVIQSPLVINSPKGTTALKIGPAPSPQQPQAKPLPTQAATGPSRLAGLTAVKPEPLQPQPAKPPVPSIPDAPRPAPIEAAQPIARPTPTPHAVAQTSTVIEPVSLHLNLPAPEFARAPLPARSEDLSKTLRPLPSNRRESRTQPKPPEPTVNFASNLREPPTNDPPPKRPIPKPLAQQKRDEGYASRAYVEPRLDVEGPVIFRGLDPVQFDTPPRILNPRTHQYEPIADYDPETMTHIKRGSPRYNHYVGKVKSGTGKSWTVTIYPDGVPPTSGEGSSPTNMFDVTVQTPNVDAGYPAPTTTWIGPVLEFPPLPTGDDNVYYYFGAILSPRICKLTANVAAATTDTTTSSGAGLIQKFDGTTISSTGVSATFYNYHTDKGFLSGAYCSYEVIDGFFVLFDVNKCANLV